MTINTKTILFVCVMSFSLQTFSQDWTYNFNEAVQESKKSDKLVSQLTGLNICALVNEKSNRQRMVKIDFINHVLFK